MSRNCLPAVASSRFNAKANICFSCSTTARRSKCTFASTGTHPFANAKELEARANKKTDNGVHIDVALELDKGVLAFADGRHLGRVHAWQSLAACPPYNELGIDAMSPEFTAKAFAQLTSKSRRPLKEFLLDQSRIAGVGNIYSCEALWHAKISPFRLANSLRPQRSAQLFTKRSSRCFVARCNSVSIPPRFHRRQLVVSRHRRHSSRLPARRRALQARRASDQTHDERQSLDLFLRPLSEVAHRPKSARRDVYKYPRSSLNLVTSAMR